MSEQGASGTSTVVIMGVAGVGKSTIGRALAAALGREFVEGDDFHPSENVRKMASGLPLVDEDRWPWLHAIGEYIGGRDGLIVACSALKRRYRDYLGTVSRRSLVFLHLVVGEAELEKRLVTRKHSFMQVGLLRSQLDTLEPLGRGEQGITIRAEEGVTTIVAKASAWIRKVDGLQAADEESASASRGEPGSTACLGFGWGS